MEFLPLSEKKGAAGPCTAQGSRPELRPTTAPPADHWSPETAWDVLERFAQSLQRCDQSRQQIKLVLDSVRSSLDADAVFWDPGTTGDSFEVLNRDPSCTSLPSVWYRDFTARLLA